MAFSSSSGRDAESMANIGTGSSRISRHFSTLLSPVIDLVWRSIVGLSMQPDPVNTVFYVSYVYLIHLHKFTTTSATHLQTFAAHLQAEQHPDWRVHDS